MYKKTSGFTLIELLVVIAIIGILASVIIVNLNSARGKGNDTRRVSDLKQIQLALEMYYDANNQYPASLNDLATNYLPAVPTDPKNDSTYFYAYTATGGGSTYLLEARLENDNPALQSDNDDTTPLGITPQHGTCADNNFILCYTP